MSSDTVFKQEDNFPIRKEGDRIYGPGIVDNKAGMIVILRGLIHLLANSKGKNFQYGLRVICSPNEETGSNGFLDIFKNLARNSDIVLGFEPAYGEGHIINGRKGNRWYEIEIEGKKAHSGRDHKKRDQCL
ncbi:M20/M25/M40 family metallo-hydrolase [Bacteriovorax sp. DB6_IX]|uniref:M20/M25/M40 family metallo-hydrolase n=1 Tax=Bacteriovorax sp. DB6_IX TaxID=1353530 RepID=UPI000555B064|nr:M20/M25/M40 family metallo-hydrolase [Bacteriovorax sp. DB6_IX]